MGAHGIGYHPVKLMTPKNCLMELDKIVLYDVKGFGIYKGKLISDWRGQIMAIFICLGCGIELILYFLPKIIEGTCLCGCLKTHLRMLEVATSWGELVLQVWINNNLICANTWDWISLATSFLGPLYLCYSLIHFDAASVGLRWKEVGTEKPTNGTEIFNDRLAAALRSSTTFREEDWKEIGFADLSIDSFIKVGDKYLKPDAPNVLVLTPGFQISIESSGCKFHCAWVFSFLTCTAGLVIGTLVHEKFKEEPQMRTFAIVSLAVSSIVMAFLLLVRVLAAQQRRPLCCK